MASATSSLPVPVSPLINTVAPVGATSRIIPSTRRRAALFPTMRGNSLSWSSSLWSATVANVASSISKDALCLTEGSFVSQVACADIPLLLSFIRKYPDAYATKAMLSLTS
jgi:hypothetical protein